MAIKLGVTAKDKITGFQGVVADDKGGHRDGHWFDVQRLDQIGENVIALDNGGTPGCDMAAPSY
jgi:hypothetical protein